MPSRYLMSPVRTRPASFTVGAMAVAFAIGCAPDAPKHITGPTGLSGVLTNTAANQKVSVCHKPNGPNPRILDVSMSALDAHVGHGDYVAGYDVDKMNAEGDGVHFTRISDALAAARSSRRAFNEKTAAACRITVTVGAGVFAGAFAGQSGAEQLPLVLDVPDVTLQGGLQLVAGPEGRATSQAVNEAAATSLVPDRALTGTETIIVVKDAADGYVGNGAVINGFAFLSGHPVPSTANGGFGIFAMRVARLHIANNRFATSLASAVDSRASSGTLDRNYVEGMGLTCGLCLAGPGTYTVTRNSLSKGGRVGMLFVPVTGAPVPAGVVQYVPQLSESIGGTVDNNSVIDHTRHTGGNLPGTPPVLAAGFASGIRILASFVPGVTHNSTITLTNNALLGNSYGLMVDGGGQDVRGDVTVTLNNNTITGSCRADLFVSFASPNRALGVNAALPYLQNSTFSVGGVLPVRRWIDHPAGRGNTLVLDGSIVGNTVSPLATVPASAPCTP